MRLATAIVVAVSCGLLALSSFHHGPITLIKAQPQPADFVSIDCGGPSTNYTDPETGLHWASDGEGFGLENVSRAANVSAPAKYQWLRSMRIFEGTQSKYCYVFDESYGIVQSNSFWAGDKPPFSTPDEGQISFMLLLDADVWDSNIDISLPQQSPLVREVYVLAVLPSISVCLAGRGNTAFISSLELRPSNKTFASVQTFLQTQGNTPPRATFIYARLAFGAAKDVRSLQNRNITAEIPEEIGDLKALVELNLQGNDLSGSIPESLAQLSNLTTLFLQDNNLSGPIPQGLLDKKVDLRLAGNPILCKDSNASYCDQQPVQTKNNESSKNSSVLLVAVIASTCAVVLILLASILIFLFRRKGKNDSAVAITHAEVIKYSNLAQHFTSQQIERITNDFKFKLGAGGFGDVFFGTLSSGLNVAVKVSSRRGQAQEGLEFLNEVGLLSRVHHKNLVEFVGYCIQPRLVLVYEYMANGSLENYLHGKNSVPLSWRDRLKIVVGAAQGLEYLHNGCKPPIIHRDVKCSNILLDGDLQGKISDFGISRSKLANTHMTVTNVQGTVGYIAPEYSELRITEKIDVFAFGIVLLEVVSGRPPFEGSQHIVKRVGPLLNQNQIQKIVDPSIGAGYNLSSMWKVLEVAMACVEQNPERRPYMNEVSAELYSALSFELQNETIMHRDESSDLSFETSKVFAR